MEYITIVYLEILGFQVDLGLSLDLLDLDV